MHVNFDSELSFDTERRWLAWRCILHPRCQRSAHVQLILIAEALGGH